MSAKKEDQQHQLKIHPKYFGRVLNGEKRFEVRKNDRDYQTGDYASLNEYDNEEFIDGYSGNQIDIQITYVLNGGQFGIKNGWCVFGFTRRYNNESPKP